MLIWLNRRSDRLAGPRGRRRHGGLPDTVTLAVRGRRGSRVTRITSGGCAVILAAALSYAPGPAAAAAPGHPGRHAAQASLGRDRRAGPRRLASPHQLRPRPRTKPAVIGGPLIDHGGPVEYGPQVYVVYWGWTSDPSGEQPYLNRFLSSAGGTSWLSAVNQYGGSSAAVLAGTWSDPAPVPVSPGDAQIQAEALAAAHHFGAGTSFNVQIVVATPTGHSTPGFGTQFCAYHGTVSTDPSVTYTDLPYITDAGTSCGENAVNGPGGLLDGVSIVEGHELAEVITDPLLNAWYDAGGNEIGDKCAWTGLADITTPSGAFAVQPLWSNATGGCALQSPNPSAAASTLLAAAASPSGGQDVFWKGTDGNLWEGFFDGSAWHGPFSLGMGPLGSAPTALATSGGQGVFWKGTDGNLWEGFFDGSAWHGPFQIGGMGPLGSAPAACATSGGQDVFWRGASDSSLREAFFDGSAWHGPIQIGGTGQLASAPAAICHSSGEQDVFWRGFDSNLWETYFGGSAWHGPFNLGMGPLGSPPAAALRTSTGEQDVFWEGTDSGLWQASWKGSAWQGPARLVTGPLGSPPSAAGWGAEADVFWRGTDTSLQESWQNTGAWNGPVSLGMSPIPGS